MNPLITKARAFVQKAHNVQAYGEIYPYYKHLEDVYNALIRFGFTEENDINLLVAAWLHDIIEDCAVSYNDVKKEFGFDIAEIVYCVTDELGRNRKERHEKTYPKIKSNALATILKLADRIANAEFSAQQDSSYNKMYRKEYEEFKKELLHMNIIDIKHYDIVMAMWDHLDKLLK